MTTNMIAVRSNAPAHMIFNSPSVHCSKIKTGRTRVSCVVRRTAVDISRRKMMNSKIQVE